MHIPSGETGLLDLLSFEEALAAAQQPSLPYDAQQWLYVPPVYSEYRYILGTHGQKPLICVGINPSTAAPGALDNTLKSVERVAQFNGYDSFLMFNVYAQRATNPDDMEAVCNPVLHRENMKAFRYILSLSQQTPPSIWAAWGTLIEKRSYLLYCVREMITLALEHQAQWFTAGRRSKKGHPHHPLYLRRDSPLEPFPVEDYLNLLG